MVHINMPCLNLGTCSVICVWMCLNLGISSILKQNNANLQAFIDVLPKFRQRAKYLQDLLLNFLHFAEDFAQNIKTCAKENGTVQNPYNVVTLPTLSAVDIINSHKCKSS